MSIRYAAVFILSSVLALLPVAAAPAAGKVDPSMWVCAGYFENRLDRVEASYGIRIYRERFLATRDGAVRRAVFLFPVAFRILRDHLRSQANARFGEARFAAHKAFDLDWDVATEPDAANKAAAAPPKPGDQVAALPDGGVRLDSAPAIRFVSKPYNGVPSRDGWSTLTIVALDGGPILGSDSTLVVVWRRDSAKEWGTGSSGSLFDFGRHRIAKTYVTSSEYALMERLKKLYATPFAVIPLSPEGPLSKDVARFEAARGWLKRYKDNPNDAGLQAPNPGHC